MRLEGMTSKSQASKTSTVPTVEVWMSNAEPKWIRWWESPWGSPRSPPMNRRPRADLWKGLTGRTRCRVSRAIGAAEGRT